MKHGMDMQEERDDEAGGPQARLALTRMLIWAEREARLLDKPQSAERIRHAIEALFDDLEA